MAFYWYRWRFGGLWCYLLAAWRLAGVGSVCLCILCSDGGSDIHLSCLGGGFMASEMKEGEIRGGVWIVIGSTIIIIYGSRFHYAFLILLVINFSMFSSCLASAWTVYRASGP